MNSRNSRQAKKKIIFSSYDDLQNPFYAGGGAHAVHEIAKRFTSEYAVTVITGNYHGARAKRIDGVQYKRIGPPFLGPRIGQLFFHALLPFSVKKEQFDIWIESFTPPFSTSCLQLFTKKPVIGLVHMLSAEDMERKYKLPFGWFERLGLKTYNYFIALTDVFQKKIAQSNKQANITVIPLGVEKAVTTSLSKPLPRPFFLYLGRIEVNQKGLDLLLESYKSFAKKSDAQLVIAGSGSWDEQKKLIQRIHAAKLEDKVMLVGQVTGRRKSELLQHCSAVVVPSRFETFCTVALEAMSYGKPLIHFGIDGLSWIPQTASIRVKPFSTQGLQRAMEKVMTDKQLTRQLGISGRKEVKNYSWEVTFAKYQRMIHDILKDYERSHTSINH